MVPKSMQNQILSRVCRTQTFVRSGSSLALLAVGRRWRGPRLLAGARPATLWHASRIHGFPMAIPTAVAVASWLTVGRKWRGPRLHVGARLATFWHAFHLARTCRRMSGQLLRRCPVAPSGACAVCRKWRGPRLHVGARLATFWHVSHSARTPKRLARAVLTSPLFPCALLATTSLTPSLTSVATCVIPPHLLMVLPSPCPVTSWLRGTS